MTKHSSILNHKKIKNISKTFYWCKWERFSHGAGSAPVAALQPSRWMQQDQGLVEERMGSVLQVEGFVVQVAGIDKVAVNGWSIIAEMGAGMSLVKFVIDREAESSAIVGEVVELVKFGVVKVVAAVDVAVDLIEVDKLERLAEAG